MAISMLKIRRPLGRLIFNMGIAIPGKTVFLIETAPRPPNDCTSMRPQCKQSYSNRLFGEHYKSLNPFHWDVLQMPFSDVLSWMKMTVFWLEFQQHLFWEVQLTISHQKEENSLSPNRQQAITCANDGLMQIRIDRPICVFNSVWL